MPEPYLGGLRLEEFLVLRHKVTNACCRPSGDLLDILCKTVIAIRGMETGHGQEMFIEMLAGYVDATPGRATDRTAHRRT